MSLCSSSMFVTETFANASMMDAACGVSCAHVVVLFGVLPVPFACGVTVSWALMAIAYLGCVSLYESSMLWHDAVAQLLTCALRRFAGLVVFCFSALVFRFLLLFAFDRRLCSRGTCSCWADRWT